MPLILCARTALGTINHTLLSLEAIRARDIPLLGIAFIGEANEDSEAHHRQDRPGQTAGAAGR